MANFVSLVPAWLPWTFIIRLASSTPYPCRLQAHFPLSIMASSRICANRESTRPDRKLSEEPYLATPTHHHPLSNNVIFNLAQYVFLLPEINVDVIIMDFIRFICTMFPNANQCLLFLRLNCTPKKTAWESRAFPFYRFLGSPFMITYRHTTVVAK